MSVQAVNIIAARSAPAVASAPPSKGGVETPALRWLHTGGPQPSTADAQQRWEELARAHPSGSVFLLPRYVLSDCHYVRPPLIYARWKNASPAPALASLAALVPYDVPMRLPRWMRRRVFSGRKVLDNTLLGESDAAAMLAFAQSLGRLLHRREADYILFRDLDIHSPMREALLQASQQRRFHLVEPSDPMPHWWIRFPEKPEQYWSQFSKKTRYNFRYRAKHLDHTVRCLRTVGEVSEFVQKVKSLVCRTWQHRRLEVLFDVEERLEAWKQLAAAGAFRSYLLEQGDRLVAFAMGMQWKGLYIYEETGYDPLDAPKSPGQVLLYRVIEDLIARDTPQLLDFGFGDSEYKRIYANHQTTSGPLALVRQGPLPLALMSLFRARSLAGRAARRTLEKLGILSTIRHLYRGHGGAPAAPTGSACNPAAKDAGPNDSGAAAH